MLYILDASLHARMIYSGDEPSQGLWFGQPNIKAKEPVWSPRGDYIAFASNHEVPDGSQLVYWSQFPGPNRELYLVDVGADDSFDWRSTSPKQITFEGDNWDPIWVK